MNAILLLFFGVLVGIVTSIPPAGPGALLQIRRGLQGRFREGMAVAVGGGLADATYGLLAVLGLELVVSRFPDWVRGLRWVGLAALVGLGLYFLFSRHSFPAPNHDRPDPSAGSLGRDFLGGLTLTGSNLANLVTWTTGVAIMTSFDLLELRGASRFTFPAGVMVGDVLWSAVLLTLLLRYGSSLSGRLSRGLMRAVGLFFLVFAGVHASRI